MSEKNSFYERLGKIGKILNPLQKQLKIRKSIKERKNIRKNL